ncbi:hypothetical protein [Streptomyces sp. NPDC058268]
MTNHTARSAARCPLPAARCRSASATVTSLHEWRLTHLPPDTRLLPSVTP